MLNILINAYAINPHWGSEPGMGWNWVVNLAKYCNLFIITEGEWKDQILEMKEKLPQKDNMHFYFNPVPDRVRTMCWNQGDWRFYWYYRKWQKQTLEISKRIIKNNHIDVIHHLNMIGFREPGYLWKIKHIPYVWGPIGGMELMPIEYLNGIGWKQKQFCKIKNIINETQYKYQPRVRAAIRRADVLISSVKGVQDILTDYYHKESELINETGTMLQDIPVRQPKTDGDFNILWVGKFDFRKQLGLAIRAVAAANIDNVSLHICGTGREQDISYYQKVAEETHAQCIWHGSVEHDKIKEFMANADLLLFTSIMEATSTVVIEAISSGLPILCFNTCGFGSLVKEFAGEVIELSNPDQSISDFSDKIKYFYNNRSVLNRISKIEIEHSEYISWENKARQMADIYMKISSI